MGHFEVLTAASLLLVLVLLLHTGEQAAAGSC
jgi:preprotein translocase subunit SecG